MKRILILLSIVFYFSILSAQTPCKVPISLLLKAQQFAPGHFIGILVEGDPIAIAAAVKNYGGFLAYNTGAICSVQLPAGAVQAFCAEPVVKRVNPDVNNRVLNDTMKTQTRVMEVRNGLSPLTQGYSGQGIIMGIIDSGIDFNHPDFKDSTGRTRILKIWDQRDATGPAPGPWNYGTQWDSAQINATTCTHNDLQYWGHGTQISGIAGGNGRSVSMLDMSGVAPDVEFMVVALDFVGANSPVAVADAAAWIYAQAQALGRPCVINASVGDYYGSHDGQDLQALMIDSLLNTTGRVMVGAAGNAGDLPIHLSYNLTADTNFTWFTSNGTIYLQLWANLNNFSGAQMAIGATRSSSWTNVNRTGFTNIAGNLNVLNADTLYNANGDRVAIIQRIATTQGSAYSMEYLITPDSAGLHWSLELTGTGGFHLWSFNMVNSNLPAANQYPRIVDYKLPDYTHNIVSSFQCSDKVVTVGNYVNRTAWPNYNNGWSYDTTVTAGDIMYNSSRGPTRDGRVKPEITAPGANSFTCGVISMMPGIIAGAPQDVTPGGYHVRGGGTSASSPVVAGAAALWLERFPNSSWTDFKTALINCAHTDGFTGNTLPDNTWGYGKTDAFALMTNCALTVNNNESNAGVAIPAYPNPIVAGNTVWLNGVEPATTLWIYNAAGQLIINAVNSSNAPVEINTAGWAPGLYLIRTSSGGTARIVVQ